MRVFGFVAVVGSCWGLLFDALGLALVLKMKSSLVSMCVLSFSVDRWGLVACILRLISS